jgi:hypothetical protein
MWAHRYWKSISMNSPGAICVEDGGDPGCMFWITGQLVVGKQQLRSDDL